MTEQQPIVRFDKLREHNCLDLSNEDRLDSNHFVTLLKQHPFLERLRLPKVDENNCETLLNTLHDYTMRNTLLVDIQPVFRKKELSPSMLHLYEQIESHLVRNKNRIFAIHGGGNIGLGCMADVIFSSPLNYNIQATSSDQFLSNLINSANRYDIQSGDTKNTSTTINNIHIIHSKNEENIIKLYQEASLLALCLTEEAFLKVAPVIAKAIIARYELDRANLKILILMNKVNCDQFVQRKIAKEISLHSKQADYCKKILGTIQFIPTVVTRIVQKINQKVVMTQLRQQLMTIGEDKIKQFLEQSQTPVSNLSLEQKVQLITSSEKLKKAISHFNLHVSLFKAEKEFSLYVPASFQEAKYLPTIKKVHNLSQFVTIKNKYFNGPHAILAWIGGLMGCQTIAEAIRKPSLALFIKQLMKYEIGPILKAEYPSLSNDDLQSLMDSFIERCEASLDDPISRVGRDPLRKLHSGDRVRGVIELRKKHQLKISTTDLEKGIAAGILYAIKNVDPSNAECQKIREIYNSKKSYEAILCYKGPYADGFYPGFEPKKDKKIIRNILRQIALLEKTYRMKKSKSNSSSAVTEGIIRKILCLDKQQHLSTPQMQQLIQTFKRQKVSRNELGLVHAKTVMTDKW